MEWIFTHGVQAVVNASQLHTRGETPPVASHIVSHAFAVPIPPDTSQSIPEFIPSVTFEFENLTEDMADTFMNEDSESDEDSENYDFDFDDEDAGFAANPDTPVPVLVGGAKRTLTLLQSNKLPTRVLDDAFQYMDRLLRLLSKKNSAYEVFARDFSEAIFIRDQTDQHNFREVLTKHGIDWEYAKRAKSAALNRRIRRYIPEPSVLLRRLEALITAYEDIQCSTKKGRCSFFPDEAKEMVQHLLQTISRILQHFMLVRLGFITEQAKKYRGHYALWVRDEIVELAANVGCKTSFPLPRVLSTRIATSETIGILPISKSLAETLKITTLPRLKITGLPHHRDTPVHVLTRLCTKPVNRYRYLQLRQRTLCAVVPVHTHKEYMTFKAHINHTKFRKGTKVYPPHEHWKNIDFLKFAQFWNELVDAQPRSVTDSNLRLYYKLPQHLETHHKKTILWKSECATLSDGSNFASRKQLLDILNSPDNHADTLAAIPCLIPCQMANWISLLHPTHSTPDEPQQSGPQQSVHLTPQPIQANPVARPLQQTFLSHASAPVASGSKRQPRRCALCVKAACEKRSDCRGSGKQSLCMCGHPALNGKQVRVSEATIAALLERRSLG
ncbi:hypothetical protein B0H13DRAFT_2505611 [Mycena leptocephala]|nr:hypothetical protein B0H13DRAFT_2505611 [Mycena leptocephala]